MDRTCSDDPSAGFRDISVPLKPAVDSPACIYVLLSWIGEEAASADFSAPPTAYAG